MLQICYQNEDPNDLRLETYLRYTLVLKPAFKALENKHLVPQAPSMCSSG